MACGSTATSSWFQDPANDFFIAQRGQLPQ
jgi:hypothetical protein